MPIFTDIAGLLRAPIGNNMENDPRDVENTKRNFAAEGRYKRSVENGYIDQELNDAIIGFQRDKNLRIDGIMNPGGETEASLISSRLKLPRPELPEKDENGIQQANAAAVPLFGALALGLGMSATGAMQWWQSQSHKDREAITKGLQEVHRPDVDDDPFKHCDEIYDRNLKRCEEIYKLYGENAYRICKESATTQYAQCRGNKPKDQWRKLQVK
jgi:hypothetical protein